MTKDSNAGFVASVNIQTKRRILCSATWTRSIITLVTAAQTVGRLPLRRMRCSFIKENTINREIILSSREIKSVDDFFAF